MSEDLNLTSEDLKSSFSLLFFLLILKKKIKERNGGKSGGKTDDWRDGEKGRRKERQDEEGTNDSAKTKHHQTKPADEGKSLYKQIEKVKQKVPKN